MSKEAEYGEKEVEKDVDKEDVTVPKTRASEEIVKDIKLKVLPPKPKPKKPDTLFSQRGRAPSGGSSGVAEED